MLLNHKEKVTPVTKNLLLIEIFFQKYLYDKKVRFLLLLGVIQFLLFLPRKTSELTIEFYISMLDTTRLYSFIILPLITLILGISAIAEEKENKTISQFLSRPISRQEIVFSKWIVSVTIGVILIVLINLMGLGSIILLTGDPTIVTDNLSVVFMSSVFLSFYSVVYISVFLLIGTIINQNQIMWGFFIAYFEVFFGQFIFGLGSGAEGTPYSISNHIYFVASEYLLPEFMDYSVSNFDPISSLLVLIILIIIGLGGSMVGFRKIDIK